MPQLLELLAAADAAAAFMYWVNEKMETRLLSWSISMADCEEGGEGGDDGSEESIGEGQGDRGGLDGGEQGLTGLKAGWNICKQEEENG